MKKTLLSITAALAVCGTANAAPTVEQRRAMCEDFGDVWVETADGAGACVEENPCESDDPEIVKAYCNRTFKDVSLYFDGELNYLLKAYLLHHGYGYNKCNLQFFGGKYYKCVMNNSYIVFEAPGAWNAIYRTVEEFNEYAKDSWTYVLGHVCELSLDGHYDWNKSVCKGLTPQQCVDASNVLEPLRRNGYIEFYYSDDSNSCIMK